MSGFCTAGEDERALIFDIERCASKDGPGIRSVVFFKGCNLRCAWCHNPEGISARPELYFETDKCVRCGACLAVCKNDAHILSDDGKHTLDRQRCHGCFACCDVCFSGALKKVGARYGVSELLRILLEDEEYYKTSGGGVTLSGGEVTCQGTFAAWLLRALRERGIHTAIETNLCFPRGAYPDLLSQTDLIMADVKTASQETFRKHIGRGFDLVMENLRALEKSKTPLILRTPVVPGINDSEEEIHAISLLAKRLESLEYYELLSYHPLGVKKGQCLGLRQPPFIIPSRERMLRLANVAKDALSRVRVDGKDV